MYHRTLLEFITWQITAKNHGKNFQSLVHSDIVCLCQQKFMEKIFTVLGPQSLVQCVPGGHPVPEEGNGAPMALLTMLQSCLHWTPLVYDIHSPGQSLATQALACQFKLLFWFLVNIATSRVTQAIIYKQETIISISQYSPLILLCHPFTISYYYVVQVSDHDWLQQLNSNIVTTHITVTTPKYAMNAVSSNITAPSPVQLGTL